MYKLVVLIHALDDENKFDELWPRFLYWAEQMPGLVSESSGRVAHQVDPNTPVVMLHELFFTDLPSAELAMNSVSGRKAGQILQLITQGKMTLFLADHHEDTIENIVRSQMENPMPPGAPVGPRPPFVQPKQNLSQPDDPEDTPDEPA